MKISFLDIRWCNLLSTGNSPITIDLKKTPTTLIIGENGAGKSQFLDALCFALFGKPYRNVNRPQLVNSVNGGGLEVTLRFRIGKSVYKIVRGLKPTILEIYKDDVLIEQDSSLKDYQNMLEENILRMSYKSFTQIILLGNSSFTSFMELTPAVRRTIIEDILEIGVFSDMSNVSKKMLSSQKTTVQELTGEASVLKTQKELTENALASERGRLDINQQRNNEKIGKLENEIDLCQKQISDLQDQKKSLCISITDEQVEEAESKAHKLESQLNQQVCSLESSLETLKKDTCPECDSVISLEHRSEKLEQKRRELKKVRNDLIVCQGVLKKLNRQRAANQEIRNKISQFDSQIRQKENQIHRNQNDIKELQEQIDTEADDGYKNELEEKCANLETDYNTKLSLCEKEKDELTHIDVLNDFLKDSGIRSIVIEKYLPVINHLINKYLDEMGFPVLFEMNEHFSEIIRSRHRDVFSYSNFSEGEKFRINIAILFAWREIAALKNSVSCDILVLDEIFDSSLDSDGVDDFLKLLQGASDNTSVFVISHKIDAMRDRFDRVIKVEKNGNFTTLKELSS